MGLIEHKFDDNFITTNVDRVLTWARENSLWPLGFGRQHTINARWWLERPLWIVVPGVILVGIVAVMGGWERRGRERAREEPPGVSGPADRPSGARATPSTPGPPGTS